MSLRTVRSLKQQQARDKGTSDSNREISQVMHIKMVSPRGGQKERKESRQMASVLMVYVMPGGGWSRVTRPLGPRVNQDLPLSGQEVTGERSSSLLQFSFSSKYNKQEINPHSF